MKLRWRSLLVGLVALNAAHAVEAARPFESSPFGSVVAAANAQKPDAPNANRLALLSGGYDALLVRIHLIRHAKKSVEIQTFIWTNDEVGRLMMCELIEAARRGVRVRIIADHLVSEQDPATIAFLATVHPNLEIKHYRPTASRMKPSLPQKLIAGLASFVLDAFQKGSDVANTTTGARVDFAKDGISRTH